MHLDLSQNRLEGTRGGAAINRILGRRCKDFGGVDLKHLDLANNKLGNGGFAAITHHLITNEDYDTLTLNISNNEIDEVRLFVPLDAGSDLLLNITNLILDGNIFRPVTFPKLASLLSRGHILTNLSLNRCKLGNEGLAFTFDAIQMLKKLRKVEYANNNIFDAGIAKICPIFGKNQKSELSIIKFNTNEVTD